MNESVTARHAHDIIVFGRGHEPGRLDRLSAASLARVDRVVEYVAENAEVFADRPARIVFSGGWGGAAGAVSERPLADLCEGSLMLAVAREQLVNGRPLTDFAELHAEVESSSTLENALFVQAGGFFSGARYDAADPLGLVAHTGHLRRAGYFCRKVFRLSRPALLYIPVGGRDQLSAGLGEPIMVAATRLACLGADTPQALRRRERWMVEAANRLRLRPSAGATDRR